MCHLWRRHGTRREVDDQSSSGGAGQGANTPRVILVVEQSWRLKEVAMDFVTLGNMVKLFPPSSLSLFLSYTTCVGEVHTAP